MIKRSPKSRIRSDIKHLLAQAEVHKARIAVERNKLRDIINDLESLQTDLDEAVDSFDSGLEQLKNAVELISQYV